MTDTRTTVLLTVSVATPIVLATIAVLAFSGLEIAGHTPSAIGPPRNIAEAVGMGAPSEVLRLLDFGADPNRVLPVRREIISSTITRVTALEAAIWSHHREMMELLDRRGAIVDADTRQHLICLTKDVGDADILAYLSAGREVECEQGRALGMVAERSRKSEQGR
jgi:hypothetical protein